MENKNQETIWKYFIKKPGILVTKARICQELEISRNQVDLCCRELRRQKRIGMYMRKYWEIIIPGGE